MVEKCWGQNESRRLQSLFTRDSLVSILGSLVTVLHPRFVITFLPETLLIFILFLIALITKNDRHVDNRSDYRLPQAFCSTNIQSKQPH